jgi:hypothetical protein
MANNIALNLDLVNNLKMKTYFFSYVIVENNNNNNNNTPISHNELLRFKNMDWQPNWNFF